MRVKKADMRAHKRKEQGKKKHGLIPASFAGKTKFIVFLESRKTEIPVNVLSFMVPLAITVGLAASLSSG